MCYILPKNNLFLKSFWGILENTNKYEYTKFQLKILNMSGDIHFSVTFFIQLFFCKNQENHEKRHCFSLKFQKILKIGQIY